MNVKRLKILIADSSLATALQLKIQLETLGHHVLEITTNAFRLKYLVNTQQPDLLILDTENPSFFLEESIKELKIPTMFITCFGEKNKLDDVLNLNHSVGYFVKPIDIFTLRSTLKWVEQV